MNNYILFDDKRWRSLLPLTFTRPVAGLRIGIDTIHQKWEYYLNSACSYLCEIYLSPKFPTTHTSDNIYIFGGVIPDENIVDSINKLNFEEQLIIDDKLIAIRSSEKYFSGAALAEHARTFKSIEYKGEVIIISNLWHIFQWNNNVLRSDYKRFTKNKISAKISDTNIIIGDDLFIEDGVSIEASSINTKSGPVYIAKNAEIMEGAMLRGPLYIGENSTIKMGAKIYGATTVGPHCKIGGELNNVVFQSYSNKAHDGFLGNSVIGEWCNIGADSNNSNLKNNYTEVKLWDYSEQRFIPTGLQFCGLIMGDHSKCAINTMFNTGTVVGVNANIYGDGFPRNFIPSFSWGGNKGFVTYKLKDAIAVAQEVMKRRDIELPEADNKILTTIYELSEKYRKGQLIFLHK